jgi:hypothetical protein
MHQADPLLHNYGDTQDGSPYSYSRNNYLAITDPTGRKMFGHVRTR